MITNLIDEIEQTKCDAMFDVFNSLIVEYNKYVEFGNVTEIFQEGEILDNVKERGKNDSTFVKIIKFIPRLLSEIWNKIKKKFKIETAEDKRRREEAERRLQENDDNKHSKIKLGDKIVEIYNKINFKKVAKVGGITCVSAAAIVGGGCLYKFSMPRIRYANFNTQLAVSNQIKKMRGEKRNFVINLGKTVPLLNLPDDIYVKVYKDRFVLHANTQTNKSVKYIYSPENYKKLIKRASKLNNDLSKIKDDDPKRFEKIAELYDRFSKDRNDIIDKNEKQRYYHYMVYKPDMFYKEGQEYKKNIENYKKILLEINNKYDVDETELSDDIKPSFKNFVNIILDDIDTRANLAAALYEAPTEIPVEEMQTDNSEKPNEKKNENNGKSDEKSNKDTPEDTSEEIEEDAKKKKSEAAQNGSLFNKAMQKRATSTTGPLVDIAQILGDERFKNIDKDTLNKETLKSYTEKIIKANGDHEKVAKITKEFDDGITNRYVSTIKKAIHHVISTKDIEKSKKLHEIIEQITATNNDKIHIHGNEIKNQVNDDIEQLNEYITNGSQQQTESDTNEKYKVPLLP